MGKVISKLRGLLAKLLIVIAIISVALVIIYGQNGIEILGTSLTGTQMSLLAVASIGLAYVVDANQASRTVSSIGKGASDVAKEAGEVLGDVLSATGNVLTSTIRSWLLPAAVVVGGYLIYKDVSNDETSIVVRGGSNNDSRE